MKSAICFFVDEATQNIPSQHKRVVRIAAVWYKLCKIRPPARDTLCLRWPHLSNFTGASGPASENCFPVGFQNLSLVPFCGTVVSFRDLISNVSTISNKKTKYSGIVGNKKLSVVCTFRPISEGSVNRNWENRVLLLYRDSFVVMCTASTQSLSNFGTTAEEGQIPPSNYFLGNSAKMHLAKMNNYLFGFLLGRRTWLNVAWDTIDQMSGHNSIGFLKQINNFPFIWGL